MEMNKVEFLQLEEVAVSAKQLIELEESMLALVGGGIGDTIL